MLYLYNENGVLIRDIHTYQSNEVDMGEYSINCDVTIPGRVDFHPDWYLSDGFNIFNLGVRKPTGRKNTDSRSTTYSLVFKHEREDLKRYTYMDFVELGSGNPQPNSSIVPIRATLTEFVHRLNVNLRFYMGTRWQVYLPDGYIEDGNVVTYTFDNASLWDVLIKTYELYKVRWDIVNTSTQLEIRMASKQREIEHIFEYGANNGLISIERSNPLDRIITRLRGKGSETNMPQRYFKTASSNYLGDPDANPNLSAMHFKNIMPKCYRDYVRGYNAGKGTGTWAFNKGVEDKVAKRPMSPVDYSLSDMESLWGVSYGAISPNEKIYPTIQGATREGIGRVDEIIAVEEVLVDSPPEGGADGSTSGSKKILLTDLKYKGSSENGTVYTKTERTEEINIDKAVNKITSKFSMGALATYGDTQPELVSIEGSNSISVSLIVKLINATTGKDYTSWTYINKSAGDLNWENVPIGRYYIRIDISWSADKVKWIKLPPPFVGGNMKHIPTELNIEVRQSSYIVYESEASKIGYQPKFSVWIKDPWGVPKMPSETDTQYTLRVWKDLATSSEEGEMTMMFSDGLLAGEDYEFKLIGKRNDRDEIIGVNIYRDETKTYNGQKSFWRIELAKSEAELDASNKYLPNTMINAKPGDHFFFIHIQMPYEPYVYDAENRVQAWLDEELAKKDEEFPTFNISPSRIFCASFSEAGLIIAGSRIRIRNTELIGSSYITLNIQSVTKNFTKDRINPDWTITATDEIIVSGNPISILEGTVEKLSSNVYSNREAVAQAIKALQSSFLRKDGVADTTYSPTTFKESIIIGEDGIRDDNFEVGDLTGKGAAIYTDGNGNRVLETDIIVARKKARFNEVEINQVTYSGGKQVFSAAGIVVSEVSIVSGGRRLYFDTKQSSVVNKFKLNDGAFCQRFEESGVKYYWARVIGVGAGYIDISTTDADGDVDPAPGDNVAQLGNKTDTSRQAAFIIDVVRDGGGLVQWYDDITDFTLTFKDSVSIGRIDGKTWMKLFGNMYVGNRTKTNFIDFDGTTLTVKGNVSILGGDARTEINAINAKAAAAITAVQQEEQDRIDAVVEINKELGVLQNQIDGVVENWFYAYEPTTTNYPASEWVNVILKKVHVGDTFTSVSPAPAPDAGKAWRWVESPVGTFKWTPIADSDAVKALLEAAKAQATADGKSSTFTIKPTKYKLGDTWLLGADVVVNSIAYKKGDMLTASSDSETYVQSHWSKRVRYTDDTLATQANEAAASAMGAATAASESVGDLNAYVDGAFKDGVIDAAEAKAIEKYINVVNETKASVDATYTTLYSNVFLSGNPKTSLASAKTALDAATTNLLNSINAAISDGLTTDAEKADVDAKYKLFNTAYASLSTRIAESSAAIEQALKAFSDNAQNTADSLKYLSDAMVKGSFGIYGGVALGQVVGVTDVGQAGDITKVQSFMSGIVANRVYFGADQQNAYNKCVAFADQDNYANLPMDDRPSFCVYRNKVDGKIRVYIKEIDTALLNTAAVVHTHETQLIRPATFVIPRTNPAGLATGEYGLYGNPGRSIDVSVLSKIRYDAASDCLLFECGIASYKYVSARGIDPTSGSGGGLDPDALWSELGGTVTAKIIGLDRLPTIPYNKISGTPSIPSVPSWALASSKPTYSYTELTNKPNIPTVAAWAQAATKPTYSIVEIGSVNNNWKIILTANPPVTITRFPVWSEIDEKPTTFTPSAHTHLSTEITNISNDWRAILTLSAPVYIKRWPSWSEVTDKPSVIIEGDARLTNARPASDVYAWAKASTKPSYTAAEVGAASSSALNSYLPLSGGYMSGKIYIHTSGSMDNYGGAFEIRERDHEGLSQSSWDYAPKISFHWGGRAVNTLGMTSSGNIAWGNNTLWHEGNLNRSDAPFTVSNLTLYGAILSSHSVSFLNDGSAQRILTGGVLVSGNYADENLIPLYGIYAKGDIKTAEYFRCPNGLYFEGYDMYVGRVSNVLSLDSKASEICINGDSNIIHVNYRNGIRGISPLHWYWRAGTSTSWSSHEFGRVHPHYGVLIPDGAYSWIDGIKATAINNQPVLSNYNSDNDSSYHPLVNQRSRDWCCSLGRLNDNFGFYFAETSRVINGYTFKFEFLPHYGLIETTYVLSSAVGIYSDGYISARGVDPGSDIRRKKDIIPLASTLDYILNTNYVSFRWKEDNKQSLGIIAQEEQSREYGYLVREDYNNLLTYSYDAHVALVGNALKELYLKWYDKESEQDRRIKELEEEVKQLKKMNYANS